MSFNGSSCLADVFRSMARACGVRVTEPALDSCFSHWFTQHSNALPPPPLILMEQSPAPEGTGSQHLHGNRGKQLPSSPRAGRAAWERWRGPLFTVVNDSVSAERC
ncbi:hypothetical protein JZ751_005870 [Albula glossodonta]|uniref:Uncharacterized protein n=1 Tax=Albula glossodonta TaxID=121402 RepID=A0A8T2P0M6_9TELE|nr:hypothetical protein JZ751_005870 [Albula glossodonta]